MANTLIYQPKGRAREYAEWAVNIYQGCEHGCTYCYAPLVLHKNRCQFHETATLRPGFFERLEREATKGQEGKLITLCFTSDPYQQVERELCATRRTIEILHSAGANVCVLTKAPTLALRDADLFGAGDEFATTLTFGKHQWEQSLKWEPKAELPHQRILGLKVMHSMGIKTWTSLEPCVDPHGTYAAILDSHPFVDLYKVGTLNYVENDTNWPKFARGVVGLLNRLDKDYILKDDLKRHLTNS